MITGVIAIVFIIAMIACASNGQWGAFAVGAVIVVLLLACGSASRQQDRAYNNFVDYWANGGKRSKADVREEKRKKEEAHRRYIEEERSKQNDPSYIGGVKIAGTVMRMQDTTYKCPACGHQMQEFSRISYSSGSEFVTYRCHRCGKELPVKVK